MPFSTSSRSSMSNGWGCAGESLTWKSSPPVSFLALGVSTMAPRPELHQILKDILGSDNVYFQPPASLRMLYPCIRYERDAMQIDHADDNPYMHRVRYLITVIDQNPDSTIHKGVANLPLCAYDRFYTAENLNHDVYRLFF